MGFRYRVDAERQLIEIDFFGELSDVDVVAVSDAMRRDPEWNMRFAVLADTRDVTHVTMSAAAVRSFVLSTDVGGDAGPLCVVSESLVVVGFARMYGLLRNRAEETQVFDTRDEALAWLRVHAAKAS